jgi:putative transcriptional regulator
VSATNYIQDGQPLELMLAGYAAGTLPRALHALVGAHLELSPVNRGFVARLEEGLSRSVVTQEPVSIRGRDARLDAIFSAGPVEAAIAERQALEPRSLRHLFGKSIDDLAFRSVLPGVKEFRLETDDETRAVLYRIRAGRKMPQHSHEGAEVTLVLQGGFTDETGHYRRGDMVIADEHLDHVPVADADEECICFAVMDAPLRLTGTFGRLVNRFVSH